MIEVFEKTAPGISFFCSVALLFLAFRQLYIYKQWGLERSKQLSVFCFLSSLFTVSVTVVYSVAFSTTFTRVVVLVTILLMFLAHFYYSRCLSFFIAIPPKARKAYESTMLLLTLLALIPLVAFVFFDEALFFNPDAIKVTGRFFSDAYLARLGEPYTLPLVGLSLFSVFHISFSLLLLLRLYQSSQDVFLIAGLVFNVAASGMEFLVLPLSVAYYVPMLYLSNLFEAFRMTSLASREAVLARHNEEDVETTQSKQDQTLDEKRLSQIKIQLTRLMEKKKLYLDPSLRLEDVAAKARVPSYLASQAIRFGLNKNFFTWLSEYRVEEVKMKLRSEKYKGAKIMDIAFESGFNTKSSFNTAFKKIVGLTPSQYRDKECS